ncbi:autotransporter outer membrane beta-barrel domain-containing protein [Actinobacillus porcinus]|uniref:autotransporter family protein n=1 Tax=Actinobacillus porcinus TaxID=51048 RepID=UPI002355C925|nr:autotransporter outer membrane beta-barrel domain-containing protein [Actinobacillus porcinus]
MKQHFALSKLYKALALCLCTSSSYSFAVEYTALKTLNEYQEEFQTKFDKTLAEEQAKRDALLAKAEAATDPADQLQEIRNTQRTLQLGDRFYSVVFDQDTQVSPSPTIVTYFRIDASLFNSLTSNNLYPKFLNFKVEKDVTLDVHGLFANAGVFDPESGDFIENNGNIVVKHYLDNNDAYGGHSFYFSRKSHNNLINTGNIIFHATDTAGIQKGMDLNIERMRVLDNQGRLAVTGSYEDTPLGKLYCGTPDSCRGEIHHIDVFNNSGEISTPNHIEMSDIEYFNNSGTISTKSEFTRQGIDIQFNQLGINTGNIETAGDNWISLAGKDQDSLFINNGNITPYYFSVGRSTPYQGTFINDSNGNITSSVYINGDSKSTQLINRGRIDGNIEAYSPSIYQATRSDESASLKNLYLQGGTVTGMFDVKDASVYLGDGKILGEEENRLTDGTLVFNDLTKKTNIRSRINGEESSILEFQGDNHNSGFTPEDLPDFVDLNIYGNWTLDNIINVSDSVNIESGSLTLNQSAPQNFAAEINIGDAQDVNQASETLSVKNIDALGRGTITLNGNSLFVLNTADNGTLTNAKITNSVTDENVQMVKLGSGEVRLNQAEFFGRLDIDEGAIILDHRTTPTVNLAQINIAPNAEFVALNGMHSQANVVNNGIMYLGHAKNEQTISALPVTIQSYQGGSASTLEFNGQLGGDNSPFERLIVTGDTHGSSIIAINNIGGRGAKTVNGIKLIEVQGESDATFELKEKISLGVYDYILEKVLKNWYLKSTIKPESGLFVSNLWAANQLFDLNLADRIGDPSLNGDDPVRRNLSVWVKARYDALKWRDEDNLFDNNVNTRSIQLGSDFGSWKDKYGNRWQIGVMGAYGTANASTTNTESDFSANGKLSGFNIGLYATVFGAQNWYVDSWLAWNEFKGKILGEDPLSYALNGVTASLESGYSYKWFDTSRYDVFIQPKVQLTWLGVGIDGGHVTYLDSELSDESGNLRSKLSARLYAKPKNLNGVAFQPFFEASWIHNTKPYAIEVPDQQITMAGIKNTAEAKLGFEAKIADQTDIWLNTAYQFGGQSYRQFTAQAGMSYRF